jgi:hypothetical protein
MRDISNIAEELFNKIRSRFDHVRIKDKTDSSTQTPEDARFFNFDYVSQDGTKFGNITISLIDEKGLKISYSKNITDYLDDAHQKEWYDYLRNLRQFAKRNMLTFDVRDINRSHLKSKDIKQQAKSAGTLDTEDMDAMNESRLFGTSRSSYQDCGPVRIIIRHNKNVDETKRGDRSRNVEALFLETQQGERRLLPFKNIHGARAMARHCSEGGEIEDQIGESICSMCKEMNSMAHFVRSTKKRNFEDRETAEMAKSAVGRYSELKDRLRRMSSSNGYQSFVESFSPDTDVEEEIDVDALKERFVRKLYDERFTDALPYVFRAHKKKSEYDDSSLLEEFEAWLNEVTNEAFDPKDASEEDRIAHGEHQERDHQELDSMMKKSIEVGHDAIDTTAIRDTIRDCTDEVDSAYEELYDKLKAVADAEGDETDARPTVIQWLRDHSYTTMADKYSEPEYTQGTENTVASSDAPKPVLPPTAGEQDAQATAGASTAPTGATGMDQGVVAEEISSMLRLAGLK